MATVLFTGKEEKWARVVKPPFPLKITWNVRELYPLPFLFSSTYIVYNIVYTVFLIYPPEPFLDEDSNTDNL